MCSNSNANIFLYGKTGTGKTCKDCGQSKPLEDFYKSPGARDGRDGSCKKYRNAKSNATKKYSAPPAAENQVKRTGLHDGPGLPLTLQTELSCELLHVRQKAAACRNLLHKPEPVDGSTAWQCQQRCPRKAEILGI